MKLEIGDRLLGAKKFLVLAWVMVGARVAAADDSLAYIFNHPGPANDDFANAIVIDGTNVTVSSHNIGATLELGEPYHSDDTIRGAGSIWWRWTAPTNGFLILATPNCQFDPMIVVYEGSDLGSLSLVARREASMGDRLSIVAPVVAGHTYHLAVPRAWYDTGRAFLSLSFRDDLTSPLPNDDFANATPLVGADIDFEAGTLGCTRESGEPLKITNGANEKSAWWTWTVPSNGVITVLGREAGDLPWLGLYSGSSVGALDPIASDPSGGFAAEVTQGVTYHIAAASAEDRAGVPLELRLHAPSPPPNDAFANATTLATNQPFLGHFLGATFETDEPVHSEGNEPAYSNSVWYAWTAPSDGFARLRIMDGRASVAVYRGSSIASLEQVAAYAGSFPVNASAPYRIAMTHGPVTSAAFRAVLDFFPATGRPPNDDFATAAIITGASFSTNAHNWGATAEPGERPHYVESSDWTCSNSVWWVWTAPSNGVATIAISEFLCRSSVLVYVGETLDTLVDVAGSAGSASQSAAVGRVSFLAQGGQAYRLCVAGAEGDMSTFRLDLDLRTDLTAPAPNDDMDQAIPLEGAPLDVRAHSFGATSPVWWKWTAPSDGYLIISAEGGLDYNAAYLYLGEPWVDSLQFAWSSDGLTDTAFLPTRVAAGAEYYLAIEGFEEALIRFRLWFSSVVPAAPINDDFTNAVPLSGSSIMGWGDTTGATWEVGEHRHGGEYAYANNSIWWRWTAPENGVALVKLPHGQIPRTTEVYTGDNISSLTRVCPPPVVFQVDEEPTEISFRASAGQAYHIAIAGDHEAQGPVSFGLVLYPYQVPPPNDAFTNGIVISGSTLRIPAHNVGARLETEERMPLPPIGPVSSVWWRWTAPANGRLALGAGGHDAWPQIWLRTGETLDSLTFVPGNGGVYDVMVGTVYHIAAYGYLNSDRVLDQGLFDLLVAFTEASSPPNDDFAAAAPLTSLDTNFCCALTGATLEPGERPFSSGFTNSVWWTFSPACDGTLVYSTRGSVGGADAAVLTGTSASNVIHAANGGVSSTYYAACAYGAGRIPLIKGQSYYIRLEGYGSGQGAANLSLSFTPDAPFDLWTAGIFPPGTPLVLMAPDADPDLDRIPNMLEAGLGFDPLSPEWGPMPVLHLDGGGGSVIFPHADPDNGVGLVLEGSATLAPESWEPLASYAGGLGWTVHVYGVSVSESGAGGGRAVTITLPASRLSGPSYFVRLRAMQ